MYESLQEKFTEHVMMKNSEIQLDDIRPEIVFFQQAINICNNTVRNLYANKVLEMVSMVKNHFQTVLQELYCRESESRRRERLRHDRLLSACRLTFCVERDKMIKTHFCERMRLKQSLEKKFEERKQKLVDNLDDSLLKFNVQQQKVEELEQGKKKAESESNALSIAYDLYKSDHVDFKKKNYLELKALKTREVSLRFRIMSLGSKLRIAEKLISKKTHELKIYRKENKALKKKVENGKKLSKRLRQKNEKLQSELRNYTIKYKYLADYDECKKQYVRPFRVATEQNVSKSIKIQTKDFGQQTDAVEELNMGKLYDLEANLVKKEMSLDKTKRKLDFVEGQNEGYKGLLQSLGFFSRNPDPLLLQEIIGQGLSSTCRPDKICHEPKNIEANHETPVTETVYDLKTPCLPSSFPQENGEFSISTKSLIPPIHPRPLSHPNHLKNEIKAPARLFGVGLRKSDTVKLPLMLCTKCDSHVENIILKSVGIK